ncbi:MAG: hypothetical protein WD063_19925 [Pirellulales bacterium]
MKANQMLTLSSTQSIEIWPTEAGAVLRTFGTDELLDVPPPRLPGADASSPLDSERSSEGSVIVIASLTPAPLEVLKPIPVTVLPDDGAFVASFFDANVNASGDTALDAFEAIKDVIGSRYRLLVKHEKELGVEPKRQLAVLREFIRAI